MAEAAVMTFEDRSQELWMVQKTEKQKEPGSLMTSRSDHNRSEPYISRLFYERKRKPYIIKQLLFLLFCHV